MVRINTLLPAEVIKKLDSIARDEHKSRSMLLREAAENLIRDYQQSKEELRRKERARQALEVQDRLRKKSGAWKGVSEIRKWRELMK